VVADNAVDLIDVLLARLTNVEARLAELTAPLKANDGLVERAKEVVNIGGLYGLSDGTVDLIAELAARCEQLTALRQQARRTSRRAVDKAKAEVARKEAVIVGLKDRLATAEQIIGYCASPTMAWNPSTGPIDEYVLVADEQLVRSALRTVIGNAQRFQREHP
jgi:hypothetical protein